MMLWAWMLWSPDALEHEQKPNKCKPEKPCVSLDGQVTRWLLYLIENPAGSYARAFMGNETRRQGGEVLNHVGKCSCLAGAHRQGQVSAAYPLGLCRTMCCGIREAMGLDFTPATAATHALALGMMAPWKSRNLGVRGGKSDTGACGSAAAPLLAYLCPPSPPISLARWATSVGPRVEDEWQNGRQWKMDFTWTGNTEFIVLGGGPAAMEDQQEHHEEPRVKEEPQSEDSWAGYEPSFPAPRAPLRPG